MTKIIVRNNVTNQIKKCTSMQDARNKKALLSAKGYNVSIVIKTTGDN